VLLLKVIFHPCDEVIFESALDHLVEEVTREELVNVGTRKVACEWLKNSLGVFLGHEMR